MGLKNVSTSLTVLLSCVFMYVCAWVCKCMCTCVYVCFMHTLLGLCICPAMHVWRPEANISDFDLLYCSPLNFLKHVPSLNQELANRPDWLASEPLDATQLSRPLLQQRNYQRVPLCLAFRRCRRSELRSSYLQNKGIASEPSLQPCFQFSFFLNWKPLVRTVAPNSFFSLKSPVATEHSHSRSAFLRNNTNPYMSYLTTDLFSPMRDLVIQRSSSTGTCRHPRHLKQ